MFERAIPIQQAFIQLVHGEAHHIQRDVVMKKATLIVYGTYSEKECEVFKRLVARNAHNMQFEDYKILFVAEDEVEAVAQKEVATWVN